MSGVCVCVCACKIEITANLLASQLVSYEIMYTFGQIVLSALQGLEH